MHEEVCGPYASVYGLCPMCKRVQTYARRVTHHVMSASLFPPSQRLQDVLTLGASLQVDLQ